MKPTKTRVMGILNVTPDSFSDGGAWTDVNAAVSHALAMFDAGAHIIDVGGESTRPGADEVDVDTEIARTQPVIAELARLRPGAQISIDTTKSDVARAALEAGASMVNDISGLSFDPVIANVAAEFGAELVLMHIRGTPQTMRWSRTGVHQDDPHYDDVVEEVRSFLRARIAEAVAAGVEPARVMVDPGIGFGKTRDQNLELLRRLPEIVALGHQVLVGTSRKSFIGAVTGRPVERREFGTAASVALAIAAGAACVRVHEVEEMVDVVRVAEAIQFG